MNATSFFELFFIFVVISALFCNGWYNITRDGYILSAWSVFFEKIVRHQKRYLSENEIADKTKELIEMGEDFDGRVISCRYCMISQILLVPEQILRIEKLLNVKFDIQQVNMDYLLKPYVFDKIYRFPLWVQYPISKCVTCYASFYGSLIWWFFVKIQKDAFLWAENKFMAYFGFWFIFIVSLSFLNTVFSKKLK